MSGLHDVAQRKVANVRGSLHRHRQGQGVRPAGKSAGVAHLHQLDVHSQVVQFQFELVANVSQDGGSHLLGHAVPLREVGEVHEQGVLGDFLGVGRLFGRSGRRRRGGSGPRADVGAMPDLLVEALLVNAILQPPNIQPLPIVAQRSVVVSRLVVLRRCHIPGGDGH